MGFLDRSLKQAKEQLTKAVDEHGDTIDRGADQVARAINDKTGHKHADKVAKGKGLLEKGLDSLDGKKDDFGSREKRKREERD